MGESRHLTVEGGEGMEAWGMCRTVHTPIGQARRRKQASTVASHPIHQPAASSQPSSLGSSPNQATICSRSSISTCLHPSTPSATAPRQPWRPSTTSTFPRMPHYLPVVYMTHPQHKHVILSPARVAYQQARRVPGQGMQGHKLCVPKNPFRIRAKLPTNCRTFRAAAGKQNASQPASQCVWCSH